LLYSETDEDFIEGLNSMFKTDEKDKIIQLKKHYEMAKNLFPDRRIVPLLITEKYFGNPNLYNGKDLAKPKGLFNTLLQKRGINFKLQMLNLEDIEAFWQIDIGKKSRRFMFKKFLTEWGTVHQGEYSYSFARFLSETKPLRKLSKREKDFLYMEALSALKI
jgi:hypothetical protein